MSLDDVDVEALGRITSVKALDAQRIAVSFDDGETVAIDLAAIIAENPVLAPLNDPQMFAQVQVSALGWAIEWPCDLDFGAPQLKRWADEQSGRVMSAQAFRAWMAQAQLTFDGAADALGLSRRMIAYYASGEKPIPKTVWLATKGYSA